MATTDLTWTGSLTGSFDGDAPFSVSINVPSSLEAGTTQNIEAVVTDGAGTIVPNTSLVWQSLDPTIATVVANEENPLMAILTTLKEGTVKITAEVTVQVTAAAPVIKSVTIATTSTSLEVNGTALVSAVVLDSNDAPMPDAEVVWSVDDATVLAVAPATDPHTADVVALKAGTAKLTAMVGGLVASADFAVTAPVVVDPEPPAADLTHMPRVWDATKSPHCPHAQWQVTDFKSSYLEQSRILSNRLWLAAHADVIMSAPHIKEYTDVGLRHIPYTLLFAPFSTDKDGDLLGSSGPYYEKWCADNGRDPEDGYVHLAAGANRYSWPIASIDTNGLVTLKYGCRHAFEDGDSVTISSGAINGTYPVSKVTWQPQGETGLLTFVIPVVGKPTTGGTARNGVASGQKTAKDRIFIDISGFPPPRYLVNPLSEVRRDFEIWRTQVILDTVYANDPDYKTPGIFVDEVMPNWAVIKDSFEFGAGTNYNAALAQLLGEIYASMKSGQNFLQPNVASYINDNGMLIADAAKSAQCESTLNPFQRNIHSAWTWWEQAMAKGVSPVANAAFSWFDTAPTKWGGGLYANDTKVLGASSIGMQREKIAEYCAYLMVSQPSSVEPHLYCSLWRGWQYSVEDDWVNCWLPLFEADVGTPLGARYSMGTFTNGKGLKVRVTARRFTNVLVLCATPDDWNTPDYTDAGAVTVQLPTDLGELRLVHSDCFIDPEPISQLTIRPAEGAILLIRKTDSPDGGTTSPMPPIEEPVPTSSTFVYKPGDATVSVTRGTRASYVMEDKTIAWAAADVARDADYSTGRRGLLLEDAGTNGWGDPNDFSGWKPAYATLSKVDVVGLDTGSQVFKITPTKEMVATHDIRRSLDPQPPSSTRQSFQFVVKDDGCSFLVLQSVDQVRAAWISAVDLTTGSVARMTGSHEVAVTTRKDGWLAVDWSFDTAKGTTPVSVSVRAARDASLSAFAGNKTDGVLIQFAQWEPNGVRSTSLIPVGGRAVDMATLSAPVSGSEVGTSGTLYEHFTDLATGTDTERISATLLSTTLPLAIGRSWHAVAQATGSHTLEEMQAIVAAS